MRIDKRVPALMLAAMLATALVGCQRKDVPSPKSDVVAPLTQGDSSGDAIRRGVIDKKIRASGCPGCG